MFKPWIQKTLHSSIHWVGVLESLSLDRSHSCFFSVHRFLCKGKKKKQLHHTDVIQIAAAPIPFPFVAARTTSPTFLRLTKRQSPNTPPPIQTIRFMSVLRTLIQTEVLITWWWNRRTGQNTSRIILKLPMLCMSCFTNLYKYAATKTSAGYSGTPGPAGHNKIAEQFIVMKMPISPDNASSKTNTTYSTIGLALNGVSFFNENAAPGDQITNELFTFDQCSGHPQNSGVYHYHVDPVCLIRDLGGSVTDNSTTVSGTTYRWIEDSGSNGNLLLGFLLDGHPVYGPIGDNHTDSNGNAAPSIDSYNGHSHSTTEFSSGTYHYHVKTANIGGTSSSVFWITNEKYFGTPGSVRIY